MDTAGAIHTVLQSDRDLAEKLHEMWEDYKDDREENALRIAIYREQCAAPLPAAQDARELWDRLCKISATGSRTSIPDQAAAEIERYVQSRIQEALK